MPTPVKVPCSGKSVRPINKVKDTIIFSTDSKCSPFKDFQLDPPYPKYPPGFSNRQPATGGGATISYDYDGSAIPDPGYAFNYVTSGGIALGNGTGVIKN